MEEKIGVVTDYLNRIGVAVIQLTDGDLRAGDRGEFGPPARRRSSRRRSNSLQTEHQGVEQALRGAEVAKKLQDPVRRHNQVFRIRDG